MVKNPIFSLKEKKQRRNWLISTTIIKVLIPLVGFLSTISSKDPYRYGPMNAYAFFEVLIFILLIVFSYKKPGNKVLYLSLFASIPEPIRFIENSKTLIQIIGIQPFLIGALVLGGVLVLGSTYIWWVKTSIDMIKINKKINKAIPAK